MRSGLQSPLQACHEMTLRSKSCIHFVPQLHHALSRTVLCCSPSCMETSLCRSETAPPSWARSNSNSRVRSTGSTIPFVKPTEKCCWVYQPSLDEIRRGAGQNWRHIIVDQFYFSMEWPFFAEKSENISSTIFADLSRPHRSMSKTVSN